MATKEEKEAKQKEIEKTRKKRQQELAVIRASNELIDESLEKAYKEYAKKGMEDKYEEIKERLNLAKSENYAMARQIGGSKDEVDNANYEEVSEYYKEKYRKRLELKGITDEQLRDKTDGGFRPVAAQIPEQGQQSFSFSSDDDDDEEVVIDQSLRTEEGIGYVPLDRKEEPKVDNIIDAIAEQYPDDKETEETTHNKPVKKEKKDVMQEADYPVHKKKDTYKPTAFDPKSIPSGVQYDVVPLPSKGECYPNKKDRLFVRYLTAADENIIASPNLYATGSVLDIILKRCILDTDFDVDKMANGDRDAIILWLRASAYGPDFVVNAKNPDTGKQYPATIDISKLPWRPFELKGDDDGYFTYKTDGGDVLKFKVLSYGELQKIQDDIASDYTSRNRVELVRLADEMSQHIEAVYDTEHENKALNDAIKYIRDWANGPEGKSDEKSTENLYTDFVTRNMVERTMSVNGETDRTFVKTYVENMRLMDGRKYREYMLDNTPGIDFTVRYTIPESDGGGSFTSFLRYDETILLS